MPSIDFQPESPIEEMVNIIWGHMQFPSESDHAFELFVKLAISDFGLFAMPNKEILNLPAAWAKALVLGPSLAELNRGGKIRNRQGLTAAVLLWSAFLYSQQPGKKISLNKAIELVIRIVEDSDFQLLGVKPYKNKGEIHGAWTAMRNVAHLWAGLFLGEIETADGRLKPSLEALQRAMGLAKALDMWGCSCELGSAIGGSKTLLDPERLIHLPTFIAPLSLLPLTVELPEYVTRPFSKR